jgi:hypothetical protein
LAAVRDISGGWRELKFERGGVLNEQERILQTNDSVLTNIAVSQPMDPTFYAHRPEDSSHSGDRREWFRKFCRYPKYFRLQYTAMVGEERYFVDTVY